MKVSEQERIELNEGMIIKDSKDQPHLVVEVLGNKRSENSVASLVNMATGERYNRRVMFLMFWEVV